MELNAKKVTQLDEEDMRRVEIEAHIARLTVSTQQLSVGSSQAARKQAKKTEKQAVKTLKRLIAQHDSPQEKMCVERYQAMMVEVTIIDSTGERAIECLADSGSERCVSHEGIMHETIKEHGVQGTPLNMVTASGERVGTSGATPEPFSFPTSDQPGTVFTHPFQIMPSSMPPIIGVDFWAKCNADKSYSRNTITIDSGVLDSKGVMGRITIPIRTRRHQKEHAAGLCAGLSDAEDTVTVCRAQSDVVLAPGQRIGCNEMDTGAVPFTVDSPMHSLNAGVTIRAEALIRASTSSAHLITAESNKDKFTHGPPTMPGMYVHPIQDGDSGLASVHLVVANPSNTKYLIIRKDQPYARLTQVTPYSATKSQTKA